MDLNKYLIPASLIMLVLLIAALTIGATQAEKPSRRSRENALRDAITYCAARRCDPLEVAPLYDAYVRGEEPQ